MGRQICCGLWRPDSQQIGGRGDTIRGTMQILRQIVDLSDGGPDIRSAISKSSPKLSTKRSVRFGLSSKSG